VGLSPGDNDSASLDSKDPKSPPPSLSAGIAFYREISEAMSLTSDRPVLPEKPIPILLEFFRSRHLRTLDPVVFEPSHWEKRHSLFASRHQVPERLDSLSNRPVPPVIRTGIRPKRRRRPASLERGSPRRRPDRRRGRTGRSRAGQGNAHELHDYCMPPVRRGGAPASVEGHDRSKKPYRRSLRPANPRRANTGTAAGTVTLQ